MPRHRNSRPRKQKLKAGDDVPGHRPVGARALKSAIDTLRPWIAESNVLDLYAGSGRFGLSALEEGAERVFFVERVSQLARKLEAEIPESVAEKAEIVQEDALTFLAHSATRGLTFDLIFVDPPFENWNDKFAGELSRGLESVAAKGAILLVKYPARVVALLRFERLIAWKSVAFGESELQYFRDSSYRE